MATVSPSLRRTLRYLTGWPRWAAAALCLLGAAASVLGNPRPAASGTVPAVVTRHPVSAGAVLAAPDLAAARWPIGSLPPGALPAPRLIGRRVALRLPAGVPLTDEFLVQPAIAAALAAGRVTTTIRLANASQLAVLQPGCQVDLYLPPPDVTGTDSAASAGPIAHAAQVLAVLAETSDPPVANSDPASGAGLIVAVTRSTAAQLAPQLGSPLLATLVQPP